MARPKKVAVAKTHEPVFGDVKSGDRRPDLTAQLKAGVAKAAEMVATKPAEAHAPIVEAKPEPDGPMSLADVNAILADNYPGFEPTNVRGEASGLKFALPGGGSITVERAKIKKCANMEELRAYIASVS